MKTIFAFALIALYALGCRPLAPERESSRQLGSVSSAESQEAKALGVISSEESKIEFAAKSAYAFIEKGGENAVAFRLVLSSVVVDENMTRAVASYKCVPCPDGQCAADEIGSQIDISILNRQADEQEDDEDGEESDAESLVDSNLDENGFPNLASYLKPSPFDQSQGLSLVWSDGEATLIGASGEKKAPLKFSGMPKKLGDTFTVELDLSFVDGMKKLDENDWRQNSLSYQATVEAKVISFPKPIRPITCPLGQRQVVERYAD